MGQDVDVTVNTLPALTWNRLNVNRAVVENVPSEGWREATIEKEQDIQGVDRNRGETDGMSDIETGLGDAADCFSQWANAGVLRIDAANTDRERLRFVCDDKEQVFRDVELLAEEGQTLTVAMLMESTEPNASGICAVRTRMRVGKHAKIRLLQVNMLGKGYQLFNDIGGDCGEDGEVEVVQVFLGGAQTYAGCLTTLSGDRSRLRVDVGYYCADTQKLDMNYVARHVGRKTLSNMQASGVLRDASHKVFRGTIDFPLGASGARGDENEDVLILGEDAVNQTVPLILCAEEDVEGNHGATIGRPADDVLFYLASRGLNEEDACNLIARAKLEAVCDRLEEEELARSAKMYLEEVTGDGE